MVSALIRKSAAGLCVAALAVLAPAVAQAAEPWASRMKSRSC